MPQNILLSGANGYLGSHILSTLLLRNLSVLQSYDLSQKPYRSSQIFQGTHINLSLFFVPDISTSGAYNKVVIAESPLACVIHTALPFLYRVVSSIADFLTPAINGTKEILSAIYRSAPSIERVIITSSCTAVVNIMGKAAKIIRCKVIHLHRGRLESCYIRGRPW